MSFKWTMTEERRPDDGESVIVFKREMLGPTHEYIHATAAYRFNGSWFDFLTGDELTWTPDRWTDAP